MSVFKVERKLEAARPLLLLAQQIINTIPKSAYVVYFRNFIQAGQFTYKNISQLKELLLPHNEMDFKIINFEQQQEVVYIKSHSFVIQNGCVMIAAKFESWQIKIQGKVINQAREGEGMVDMSIKSKKGYDQFFNFRKRYKTLQNITKKLQFKIDHRIKFRNKKQSYQFDLQQKNQQHFYLSSVVFQHPVSVVLQEITSLEDYVSADILQEIEIDLSSISRQKEGLELRVKFSNIFQLLFVFDFVNNTNFANADFIAIRLLETSARASYTKIGTENNINLHECLKVAPLINSTYYDYQWGYLNQNLQKIKAKDTIYQHLDKLTLSTKRYTSFVNQEIIDLKKSTTLVFNVEGQLVKVPLIFVLEGINCIFNQNMTVKFLIESITTNKVIDQDQKSDKRRVFEMNLEQVMNLSKINRILTSRGESMFTLKIINEEMSYFIPFERRKVNKIQFKKEAKDLMTKQEVTFKHDKKYYCLTHGSNDSDQLYLLQSTALAPFYLIEITSSSALSYQLVVGKEIIFEGSLFKQRIMANLNESMVQILSSQEGNTKIALSLNFKQIQQTNQSAATLYQFRHRLQFAEIAQSNDVSYDIEIQFEKSSNLTNLRSKISPQLKRQSADEGFFMKQFCNNGKAMLKQESLMFTLRIKKMFYNQELNYFDNEQLLTKVIAINPSFEMMKRANPLNVESQSYSTYQIEIYDKNIQKRMIYYLQVYAMKNQFLDHKDSSYKIRMPNLLWEMSNATRHSKSDHFELVVLLNRKRKNGDKVQFKNNHQKEIILNHYNYQDALTLTIDKHEIAYSKVVDALKLRCDVSDQYISQSPQSDWYIGVLNTDASNFYFLLQRKFDPYEQKNRSESDRSRKTVSRELSARSDKHKIDPLAKTINNLDLFKLKKKKNELVAQGRQLTARYVKKQEKIIALTRRLQEIQVEMIKRSKYQESKKSEIKKITKQNIKKKEFYRSICECGQRNPKYNGYCENCLKKLRERYEAYSKEYKEKSYEYQRLMFDQFNKKQKIQRLKKKIHAISNQDIIIVDTENTDTADYFSKGLEQKHYKQQIENLKVQLFELEQERVSLVQNSNWQMKKMEQKITQQDQLIYKNSQEYNNLKNKQAELAKLNSKEDK